MAILACHEKLIKVPTRTSQHDRKVDAQMENQSQQVEIHTYNIYIMAAASYNQQYTHTTVGWYPTYTTSS